MALPQQVWEKDQWRRFERRSQREAGAGGKRPVFGQRRKAKEYGNENKRVISLVFEYREDELGGQEQREKPQPTQFGARKRHDERLTGDRFRQFECADRGRECHPVPDDVAQPQRHDCEWQHHESEERRISEAGMAGLQRLATPETRRRLRISLHAGGQFDKARVISSRNEPDQKPDTIPPEMTP